MNGNFQRIIVGVVLSSSCFGMGGGRTPSELNPGDTVTLRNTYYYRTDENEYSGQRRDSAILGVDEDGDDFAIASVSERFRVDTDMEGTGLLVDGRTVNYESGSGDNIRYRVTSNVWGDGSYQQNGAYCPLHPFHSVAIHTNQIRAGSVLRIRETVGMQLPDGSTHNGLWRADDVGSAIGRGRVDLYIGTLAAERDHRVLANQGITTLSPVHATIVSLPGTTDCRESPVDQGNPALAMFQTPQILASRIFKLSL